MKKRKGLLTDLVVLGLAFAAFTAPGARELAVLVLFGAGIYWLCRRKPRGNASGVSNTGQRTAGRRRESVSHRAGRKAGTAAYDGFMSWMTPKPPTQADLDYKRCQEAKRKYAFHSAQAECYKGTRDGWWHEQEANRWRNEMR